MHAYPVIAVLAASLALPAAAQQTILVPGTAPVGVAVPHGRYHFSPTLVQDYLGRYVLSDGRSMRVSLERKHLYLQVEGEPRVEIVPLGPTEFVGGGTGLRLQFAEVYGNRTNDLTLTLPEPRRALADRGQRPMLGAP